MASDAFSESALSLVFRVGVAVFVAALGLLLVVLLLRYLSMVRDGHHARAVARFRPFLHEALIAVPEHLPAVTPWDRTTILPLWNYLQSSVRGEARDNLNEVARRLGLDRLAEAMLRGRSLSKRMLGAITLGHMEARGHFPDLLQMVTDRNPALSLVAMQAMIEMDPRAALPHVMPWIATRDDWSAARVASMLKRVDQALLVDALRDALGDEARELEPPHLVRLLRFLEVTRNPELLPALRDRLSGCADPTLQAALLRVFGVFGDPRDRERVVEFLGHPVGFVRVQAVAALRTLGRPADRPRLIAALSDESFGVRLRAARTLEENSFGGRDGIRAQLLETEDPRAQEVILLVLSESGPRTGEGAKT